MIASTIPYSSSTLSKRQLRESSSPPCLPELFAQYALSVRLAKYALATLGARLRPAQAKGGKSHSVALRAPSNIWVRIIYAMWLTRSEYDPAVFAKAQRDHAFAAA
jgi:hypothetical protein